MSPTRRGPRCWLRASSAWAARLPVAFAPAGRRYAVGGQDNVVTVVDLAQMDAVRRDPAARARERAGGGLDRAQWETFAPGTEYLGVR